MLEIQIWFMNLPIRVNPVNFFFSNSISIPWKLILPKCNSSSEDSYITDTLRRFEWYSKIRKIWKNIIIFMGDRRASPRVKSSSQHLWPAISSFLRDEPMRCIGLLHWPIAGLELTRQPLERNFLSLQSLRKMRFFRFFGILCTF